MEIPFNDSTSLNSADLLYWTYTHYSVYFLPFHVCRGRGWLLTQSAQLQEIRKVKLSRIVCDNSDNIESAQVYVMVLPDPKV
jgi:hypothetical protein